MRSTHLCKAALATASLLGGVAMAASAAAPATAFYSKGVGSSPSTASWPTLVSRKRATRLQLGHRRRRQSSAGMCNVLVLYAAASVFDRPARHGLN